MAEAATKEISTGASADEIARMMVVAKAYVAHESEWHESGLEAFSLAEEVLEIYPEMTWSHGKTRLRKAFKRAIVGKTYPMEVRLKARLLLAAAMKHAA